MSGTLGKLYCHSLALLTDLYQLTMAYGYWKAGRADRKAVFQHFFREPPFDGGYTIACGLEYLIEFIENFHFTGDDLHYLSTIEGTDNRPLFHDDFLKYLERFRFSCSVDAVPEGTVVYPHEPLVRVQGPILECQLLETPLLTLMNFQTLVATKANRVCRAARGETVLEFGLRRAQGIDGGVCEARATIVGGCPATSNVLAGKLFGIPVRGTHAHSWVMSFDSELEAFEAFADALPNNCIFLVDTYESIEGVKNAIRAGRRMRKQGHEMIGIRLDSGDLAELSIESRKMLDEAGFPDAKIVASSDLDEYRIEELENRGAQIDVWGVGTKLATAYDQPALGGVYKLTAIRDREGNWQQKLKLSDQPDKTTNPGILQIRRSFQDETAVGDVIYDELTGEPEEPPELVDFRLQDRRQLSGSLSHEDLLQPIFREGRRVYEPPPLEALRERTVRSVDGFDPAILRLRDPAEYPVGLEARLARLKGELMDAVREGTP